MLLSEEGPKTLNESKEFDEILNFLALDCPKPDLTLKDNEFKESLEDNFKEEYQDYDTKDILDWDEPLSSSDEKIKSKKEKTSLPKKKKPKSKVSQKRDPVVDEGIVEKARNSYNNEIGLYKCAKCNTERKSFRSMQQHLIWHKRYPEEDFHTSHICKECGKVCSDHSLLRAHMRLVHSPRTFVCTFDSTCDKKFKSKEGLKQHLQVHSGVKNFVCSECGYAVRTKHHLKLHVVKKHRKLPKSIPCEICGRLFRHLSNLKCHFYTHKARMEREHRCETCQLTFRTQKSLDSHMALHDPSRPYKCSICTLRYKNRDALVAHENTHQNLQYKCESCDIAYTRKDNLKRHIKEKHPETLTTNS